MIPVSAQNEDSWFASFESCREYTYGFINIRDTARNIAAEYCGANTFSEGLAAVKKDGKWGFIDADNDVVIGFQYDYARNFTDNRAIVQQGEFYGVINTAGAYVIPACYYDLIPYELEGKRYYISRDSTFYQGIIDTTGKDVLPHRYTFVIPYEPNLAKRRFYSNIPFYTTYWEIDTAKGSFYKQFSEGFRELTAESSRQDIYDTQFNRLASKNTTSYSDGFTHEELTNIDGYIEDHYEAGIEQQRAAIRRLLDAQQTCEPKPCPTPEKRVNSEEGLNEYMAQLGYEKFSGEDGKIGVKKDGKIVLPARFDLLKWWGMVFPSSSKVGAPYLEEHYAGRHLTKENDVFGVFGIAAGSREKGVLYTMKGEKVFDLENNTAPESAAAIGFTYRIVERDTAQQRTSYKFGFVNWKGQEILPPDYTGIAMLAENYLLVKREKDSARGTEVHFGLYSASGKTIIPEGVFSNIEPFAEVPNLYLAEWHDTYPTLAEQKARETANKPYVLLRIKGNGYTVVHQFTASVVYTRGLNIQTGMLKYRKNKGDE